MTGTTRRLASVMAVGAVAALTGCSGFFVPVVPLPPGSTGNYVYVANSTTGTGTLTGVPGSPLTLGYTPQAMVVTRDNKFLYVAAPGNINVYTINSDGSLS